MVAKKKIPITKGAVAKAAAEGTGLVVEVPSTAHHTWIATAVTVVTVIAALVGILMPQITSIRSDLTVFTGQFSDLRQEFGALQGEVGIMLKSYEDAQKALLISQAQYDKAVARHAEQIRTFDKLFDRYESVIAACNDSHASIVREQQKLKDTQKQVLAKLHQSEGTLAKHAEKFDLKDDDLQSCKHSLLVLVKRVFRTTTDPTRKTIENLLAPVPRQSQT